VDRLIENHKMFCSEFEKDHHYCFYKQHIDTLMLKRVNEAESFLTNLIQTEYMDSKFALCLKGSYSLHSPSCYSDLDIVLIFECDSISWIFQSRLSHLSGE
jgi:hypothetical protein